MANSTQTNKKPTKAPPVSVVTSLDFGHAEEEDLLKQEILNAAESFQDLETSADVEEATCTLEAELAASDDDDLEEYEQPKSFVVRNKSKLLLAGAATMLIMLMSAIGGGEEPVAEANAVPIPLLPSEQVAEVETKAGNSEEVPSLKMPTPQEVAER